MAVTEDVPANDGPSTVFLAIVLWWAVSLSLVGATISVVVCWQRRRQPYYRLILGLAVADVLNACTILFQPLENQLLLSTDASVGAASGTCQVLGFFMRFPLTTEIYNCYLGLFYLRMIRYRWKPPHHDVVSIQEWWAHAMAFVVPAILGGIGVATSATAKNPVTYFCDYEPSSTSSTVQHIVFLVLLVGTASAAVAATFSVYLFVRTRTLANRRFSFKATTNNKAGEGRLQDVMVQSGLYSLAFGCSSFWSIFNRVMVERGGELENRYYYTLCMYLFFPLQGFYNYFIYLLVPRYRNWRRAKPEAPVLQIVRSTLSFEDPEEYMIEIDHPVTRRTSRIIDPSQFSSTNSFKSESARPKLQRMGSRGNVFNKQRSIFNIPDEWLQDDSSVDGENDGNDNLDNDPESGHVMANTAVTQPLAGITEWENESHSMSMSQSGETADVACRSPDRRGVYWQAHKIARAVEKERQGSLSTSSAGDFPERMAQCSPLHSPKSSPCRMAALNGVTADEHKHDADRLPPPPVDIEEFMDADGNPLDPSGTSYHTADFQNSDSLDFSLDLRFQ